MVTSAKRKKVVQCYQANFRDRVPQIAKTTTVHKHSKTLEPTENMINTFCNLRLTVINFNSHNCYVNHLTTDIFHVFSQ